MVGLGADLDLARKQAYAGIGKIELPGSFFRTDIAARLNQQGEATPIEPPAADRRHTGVRQATGAHS